MNNTFIKILAIVALAIFIYFVVDTWQASVNIYASSCETASGTQLPTSLCKTIVKYRYQKAN